LKWIAVLQRVYEKDVTMEGVMVKTGNTTTIYINGKEGHVIEAGGRRFFTFALDENQIAPYQVKILENSRCRALLPMHFVRERGKFHAYYDFGGFLQLKDIVAEWKRERTTLASEMIGTVAAVAGCLVSAENYLFSCEDFCLHSDTVFVGLNTGLVRLAYVPEEPNHAGVSNRFADFVRDTAMISGDEQWKVYAEEIYRKITSCNESLSGIEKILQDKSYEIYTNSWPEISALRPHEK